MKRALRRHQAITHMTRRLNEHNNQHYNDLTCPRRSEPRAMARFKEQPKICSCVGCGNQRRHAKGSDRLTMQERRHPPTTNYLSQS